MPELPEVETMRRRLVPIEGTIVVRAARVPCSCRPISIRPRVDFLNRRLSGKTISAVDRLGKRIVLRLDTDDRLVFEPRMTGIVLIGEPPNAAHLRFEIKLSRPLRTANRRQPRRPGKFVVAPTLRFWDRRGLGRITLLDPQTYETWVGSGQIGPDACQVDADELRSRAKSSRREIKVSLLDQRLVAGIGNLYASEILFVAGVDPRTRCHRLTRAQWNRIHAAMQDVLHAAIEHEGSTLSDGTYQKALNDPGGYQNLHRVYDRAGTICPRCRAHAIIRIVQAQRATFFCPACQTKRPVARESR